MAESSTESTQPAASRRPRNERSLYPREHGASMELLFPLLSAFALGAPTLAGIALAISVILVFVSHEAVLVLLGRRGEAFRRERGAEARRMVLAMLIPASLLGLGALLWLSSAARLAVIVPFVLAIPAWIVALRGESQRTLPVELWVGTALASVALPVALDAGLSPERAIALVLVWAVSHGLGTVAARAVLYRAKDGGRGLVVARVASLVLALVCVGTTVAGTSMGSSLAWVAITPLPWAICALYLASRPPPPTRMSAIGYGLVGASLVSTALVLGLPW
ncbi:MAG: YwiC-like family protein [Sandaracinaceae bacterium]|nr:YwiC-like family protein [Sandaracinaceae bacterium]